ncbi:unnamed protein product [Caenorhabditis auriculariae]|uniref:DNA2/NAM7 helicase-like C-terminal domain-containing protein n=1 Tax=Caenorhabditis auriculariae TaxID=2777116 RepID=A0A8S1GQY6_9PELO|nr:unnamed protein product [Caenorhabditis auriculariae]
MNIVRNVYLRRKAVFCTLSSSAIRFLPRLNWHADVLIIDEAAQCTEPAVWAAIVGTKRCILVGDPAQLPAVVKSDKAISSGLQVSLMERLMKEFSNGNVGIMLDEQYRSNDAIVRWSSESFYDAKLRSHESVANQRLSDRYFVDKDSILDSPILLINTDFKSNRSREQFSHRSCYNRDEVEVIVKYVNLLLRANVPPQDIAVIAPYFAQVEELRKAIKNESVAVNSVDAFQGQEREVVIFSTVRDNKQGYLGFLREERRLNVAITRAKRQFVMIGSVKTICSDENLSSFYRYLLERKSVYDPAEVFASFF